MKFYALLILLMLALATVVLSQESVVDVDGGEVTSESEVPVEDEAPAIVEEPEAAAEDEEPVIEVEVSEDPAVVEEEPTIVEETKVIEEEVPVKQTTSVAKPSGKNIFQKLKAFVQSIIDKLIALVSPKK
mmetsp:Transcript_12688/g.21090  ORF Transcript_12688/g.21090 Transcript_12688/m.21090 type:complete len:130 (-) Transcript_12688:417-806(-)|eukprot:CAMPEP_0174962036 /NCGR_PEP_ID=MMETSP0004_2-20121128/4566_1 /TAXON_ID=420556 /ORGANISM="Ochromonas sp., Strain CCMP1393" /LENGTH=129 /DNA_ID=CAMNT_0016210535 /DNA_START=91 /DNA_END=480 /DNA_ORIENTATION=-